MILDLFISAFVLGPFKAVFVFVHVGAFILSDFHSHCIFALRPSKTCLFGFSVCLSLAFFSGDVQAQLY